MVKMIMYYFPRFRTETVTGTTKQASISTIGSFLRNQSFPKNWHRAAAPVTGEILGSTSNQVFAAVPIFAGHNDAQGNFVPDTPPPAPFDDNPVSLNLAFFRPSC
jgi:hypothetical protein